MQKENDCISLLLIGSYEILVEASDLARSYRIEFFGLQHFKFQLVEAK